MTSLTYVTLTGTFDDGSGEPLSGTVTFTPNVTAYASGVPVCSIDSPVQAEVAGGQLQSAAGGPLRLLATDNAGLSFQGLTGFLMWTVQVKVGGETQDPWSFFLPGSPGTTELFALANTPASGGPTAEDPLGTLLGGTGLSESTAAALLAALLGEGGGSMGAFLAPKVTTLTDAATILVDASLGNDFRVTLGGNRTMGAPSNPVDGQSITFEVVQDATGSRTLTWTSGTGGYSFGSGSAPTLTTTASKRDLAAFRYSASAAAWLYLGAQVLGF